MENEKRQNSFWIVIGISVLVSMFVSLCFGLLSEYNAKEFANQTNAVFDEVDKRMAVEELCELKGRIEELDRLLATSSHPTDIFDVEEFVRKELDLMQKCFLGTANPYLKGKSLDFSTLDTYLESTQLRCEEQIDYAREVLAEYIRQISNQWINRNGYAGDVK